MGATPREIAAQFLLEAATLAAAGGVLGVLDSIAVTFALSQILTQVLGPWRFAVELWAVPLALGMALGTGVVFGLLPALRGAALRSV